MEKLKIDKKLRYLLYENRELSWLKFNERVLEEAKNPKVPLCERVNFLSIYQSNLDEFFMVRVGTLTDQMHISKKIKDDKTKMTPAEQLKAIVEKVIQLNSEKDRIYENLMEEMEFHGVSVKNFESLKRKERMELKKQFSENIFPLLTPMIVGRKQPFPFLNSQDIYALAVMENRSGKRKVGIIPCSRILFPRLIYIPGCENPSFVLLEDLILSCMSDVFNGYKLIGKTLLRITRNADIDLSKAFDEDLDYRDSMEQIIMQRKKLAPIRLELTRNVDKSVISYICRQLDLHLNRVFYSRVPLDLSFIAGLEEHLKKDPSVFFARRTPKKSAMIDEDQAIIPQIMQKDILLSYPYENIRPFINMLEEAAKDPAVTSIRMTLYRLAKNSKIVEALLEAAENGKQVDVLVELKARFDEENNIGWSKTLEEAGCHVIYGIEGLKVHSKLCLITRETDEGKQFITQIGTGNYNEKTARLYTDLSLLTASQSLGQEVNQVFEALLRGEVVQESKLLMVAPKNLQKSILDRIQREIARAQNGEKAYIGLKLNSLSDKKIINKLIEASLAGVKVEMIIRGICCLKSQVPEYTEHIKVKSIVGRYLEHSRIYIFGSGQEAEIYIGSADLMTRNTIKRVEVAAPILDPLLKERIWDMFKIMFKDNVKGRIQMADGSYRIPYSEEAPLNAQDYLYDAL